MRGQKSHLPSSTLTGSARSHLNNQNRPTLTTTLTNRVRHVFGSLQMRSPSTASIRGFVIPVAHHGHKPKGGQASIADAWHVVPACVRVRWSYRDRTCAHGWRCVYRENRPQPAYRRHAVQPVRRHNGEAPSKDGHRRVCGNRY